MHETWWFEDFEPGQRFTTQGRTLTESDLVMFAGWSWDTNPVHTDAHTSAEGRFGQPIAHGMLGLSLAMGLISRLGVFEGCSIALLGVDEWKFSAPVFAGDTLRCELEILSTRPTSSGHGILDRQLTLSNQHDRVVQQGRIGLMVASRPVGAGAKESPS